MALQGVGGWGPAILGIEDARAVSKAPSVAVILCGYIAAESIDFLLGRIIFAASREPFDLEVLVADLGGSDEVWKKIEAWQDGFPVRWVPVDANSEPTEAIGEAARNSNADILVVTEPDLSYPPESVPHLVREMGTGDPDLVISNRLATGLGKVGRNSWSRIVHRLVSMLAWLLLGTSDPLSKLVACRRELLLEVTGNSTGPLVGLDFLERGIEDGRVSEVPVAYDRRVDASDPPTVDRYATILRRLTSAAMGHRIVSLLPTLVRAVGVATLADLMMIAALDLVGLPVSQAQQAGFLAAALAAIAILSRQAVEIGSYGTRKSLMVRASAVALMALLLRSAVFEIFASPPEPFSWMVPVLGVGASSLTILLGAALFVLQAPGGLRRESQRRVLFGLFLVPFALTLRGVFSAGVLLIKEESYYWNYGQHLAWSYFDHPPLAGWMIALSTTLLGDTEFAVRLPATISWLVAAFFLFGLARNLSNRCVAMQTVLLFSVLPIYFGIGLIITPDSPLHAAWAGCLYFLERALFGSSPRAWMGFGICLGLGLLSKYTIVLLLPSVLVFLVLDRASRRWLWSWQLTGALAIGAALMTPILFWNYQNGWASLLYQGPRRWTGGFDFGLIHLILASVVVLTPLGLVAAMKAVIPRWPKHRERGRNGHALSDRHLLFASVFTWIPLSVFVLHSLVKLPKINWTGPVWLMALPLIAGEMTKGTTAGPRRKSSWWSNVSPNSQVFALVVLALLGSMLHWRLIDAPGLAPERRREILSWPEIGSAVARLRSQVEGSTSRDSVVVGMDVSEISSQLSFYDPRATGENTAGRHLLGQWSEGFVYWLSPDEVVGKDLIMIAFERSDLKRPSLEPYFQSLGPIQPLIEASGQPSAAALYYRVGFLYRGASS